MWLLLEVSVVLPARPPGGGQFDVEYNNYSADGDHAGHRVGRNADLRTEAVGGVPAMTQEEKDFVAEWWETRFGARNVFLHGPPRPH